MLLLKWVELTRERRSRNFKMAELLQAFDLKSKHKWLKVWKKEVFMQRLCWQLYQAMGLEYFESREYRQELLAAVFGQLKKRASTAARGRALRTRLAVERS